MTAMPRARRAEPDTRSKRARRQPRKAKPCVGESRCSPSLTGIEPVGARSRGVALDAASARPEGGGMRRRSGADSGTPFGIFVQDCGEPTHVVTHARRNAKRACSEAGVAARPRVRAHVRPADGWGEARACARARPSRRRSRACLRDGSPDNPCSRA